MTTSTKTTRTNNASKDRIWRQLSFTGLVPPKDAAAAMEHLAGASELGMITLEMHARGGQAPRWFVNVHPSRLRDIEALLASHLSVQVHNAGQNRSVPTMAASVRLRGSHPHLSPANVETAARNVFSVISGLDPKHEIILQVILGARQGPPLQPRDTWTMFFESLLIGGTHTAQQRRNDFPRHRTQQHGFSSTIRIGSIASTDSQARHLINKVRGALKVLEPAGTRIRLKSLRPEFVTQARRPWRYPLRLSSGEASAVAGWPVGAGELPAFGGGHPQMLSPRRTLHPTNRTIGISAAPGHEKTQIGIPIQDAPHLHILGTTGTGKSTLIQNLVHGDLEAGTSVVVLDMKGDLSDDLLARVPEYRREDIVIVDAAHETHAVGINPLDSPPGQVDQTADMLLAVFESLDDQRWGVQVRQTLSTAIYTLARVPGSNLLWLAPLLTDQTFRRQVLKKVTDRTGLEWWSTFDQMKPEQQSMIIMPVMRRLHPIQMRKSLRGVLGQSQPAFDLREIYTGRKSLIVNLNKGVIGAEPARILGRLLTGLIWQLALARQRTPQRNRRMVHMVIDEAQEFLGAFGSDITDVLAMARSLGLSLTLAHQNMSQLSREMQSAIAANCRNKIMLGMSAEDAHMVAKSARGLDPADFHLLPAYHAQVNLMNRGEKTGWMTVKLDPAPVATSDPVEVYAVSQARYAVPLDEVEEQYRQLTEQTTPGAAQGRKTDAPIGRKQS